MREFSKQTIIVDTESVGKIPVEGVVLRESNPRILLIQDRLVTITGTGKIISTVDIFQLFLPSGDLTRGIWDLSNPPTQA